MSVSDSLHSYAIFQLNCKTGLAVTIFAAVGITALALGVIGYLNEASMFHSAGMPLILSSTLVLGLDIAWVIALLICNRKKIAPKADSPHEPEQEKKTGFKRRPLKLNLIHVPAALINASDTHLDAAKDFGLVVHKGRGFSVKDEMRPQKEKVLKKTKQKRDAMGKKPLSAHASFLQHTKYVQGPNSQKQEFFPEGDVLQTAICMEYDENFQPMEAKNAFFMHSAAAPQPSHFATEEEYLDAMEEMYYHLLKTQIHSGAKHILTNYWGMGAFIRKYVKQHFPDHKARFAFRVRIAKHLANAYCRAIADCPGSDFKFYIGGPTGESFKKGFQQEPCDNYNAFTIAFAQCPKGYKERIIMCPETDIFVKAQEISNTYTLKPGMVAPVSAINASDPKRFGNHWDTWLKKDGTVNAEFAIEENVFRRSSFAAYIAMMINDSWSAQEAVDQILFQISP